MPEKPKKKSAGKAEVQHNAPPALKERLDKDRNWLTQPDPESKYQLSFRGEDCSLDPNIELTRAEFVALRNHLAELRGFGCVVPEEVAHAN